MATGAGLGMFLGPRPIDIRRVGGSLAGFRSVAVEALVHPLAHVPNPRRNHGRARPAARLCHRDDEVAPFDWRVHDDPVYNSSVSCLRACR